MSTFISVKKEESEKNQLSSTGGSSGAEAVTETVSGKEETTLADTAIFSMVNIPSGKIPIQLRSVGSAPALKHNKFKLDGNRAIFEVERFLRKNLNHDKALFLYCGSGFSPTPDQSLQDLYDCFQIGSELTISYGFQETWG